MMSINTFGSTSLEFFTRTIWVVNSSTTIIYRLLLITRTVGGTENNTMFSERYIHVCIYMI